MPLMTAEQIKVFILQECKRYRDESHVLDENGQPYKEELDPILTAKGDALWNLLEAIKDFESHELPPDKTVTLEEVYYSSLLKDSRWNTFILEDGLALLQIQHRTSIEFTCICYDPTLPFWLVRMHPPKNYSYKTKVVLSYQEKK
jgi:hypothetical protein